MRGYGLFMACFVKEALLTVDNSCPTVPAVRDLWQAEKGSDT